MVLQACFLSFPFFSLFFLYVTIDRTRTEIAKSKAFNMILFRVGDVHIVGVTMAMIEQVIWDVMSKRM